MVDENTNKATILIVDDDKNICKMIEASLRKEKRYEIDSALSGEACLRIVRETPPDLILLDIQMPGIDGIETLQKLREDNPHLPVIMMTAHGTIERAVTSMKLGAYDFLTKPFARERLVVTVNNALVNSSLRREVDELRSELRSKYAFANIIGQSGVMRDVFRSVEKVINSNVTVLINGESGTGKELIARAIHYHSTARAGKPFVAVNCSALPESLLESELFGHEKGAFTGAIRSRMGRFELAQGGTIFLDEIGDMSPSLQVKVLRVLQERQFERIGGVKTINADVRIITATNQNLEKAVEEKRFREDLYYRINVIPIHLPPLRERNSDILILANHFLMNFNKLKKKNVTHIAPDAVKYLKQYQWPGNVRELQNLIEMLVVMKEEGEIAAEDLPSKFRSVPKINDDSSSIDLTEEGFNFNERVSQLEKDLLLKALKMSGGVKNKAAKLLNLNRTTLVEKLKRLNIVDDWID